MFVLNRKLNKTRFISATLIALFFVSLLFIDFTSQGSEITEKTIINDEKTVTHEKDLLKKSDSVKAMNEIRIPYKDNIGVGHEFEGH